MKFEINTDSFVEACEALFEQALNAGLFHEVSAEYVIHADLGAKMTVKVKGSKPRKPLKIRGLKPCSDTPTGSTDT